MSLRTQTRAGPALEALHRLRSPGNRGRSVTGLAVAVLAPCLVTALAAIPSARRTTIPALLYLLAVVAAALFGRLWPGLVAAALSFLGLDFFFTEPVHTLVVGKTQDLVDLAVFLAVAVATSAAISAALEQRARAQAREHQVRALYEVNARLLSGADLQDVLRDLASSLRALYNLSGCTVVIVAPDGTERNRAASGRMDPQDVVTVPLAAEGHTVGRIEMSGRTAAGLSGGERQMLDTFAGQLALAVERVRLGEEAAEARVHAQASRVRAALFSSVTHDLRTPLASITASASSLLEDTVPFTEEQRHELLRTILEESQRLNRLVTNLLDISRLRAGALIPTRELVLLEDLVSSVLERMRPHLAGRPIRVRIREGLPLVPVDVMQMDQVLTNLLENALRYSASGTEISITAVRWENMAEIRVSDRGPGIAAEERSRVFQEFYSSDVAGRRGGTGLGLAIAQAVVLAHGGQMWIEDTPGGGATIGLRLPLSEP